MEPLTALILLAVLIFVLITVYGMMKYRAVRKNWRLVSFIIIAPLCLAVLIGTGAITSLQYSWAFKNAIELAQRNPVLIKELGEPIEPG